MTPKTCLDCGHTEDSHVAIGAEYTGRACYGFMPLHSGSRVCSCERRPGGYVAGWNRPGYLPESEPQAFDTFDDAVRYIAASLHEEWLEFGEPTAPYALHVDADKSEAYALYLGFAYWVAPSFPS